MTWVEMASKAGPYMGAAVSLAVAIDARRKISRLERESDRERVLLQVHDIQTGPADGREARLLYIAFKAPAWVTHEVRLRALTRGVSILPATKNVSRDKFNSELINWSWEPRAVAQSIQTIKMNPAPDSDWKAAHLWAFAGTVENPKFRLEIIDLGTRRVVLRHTLLARDDA